MANLNKVMLIGNLTRDVETRGLPNGGSVYTWGLAINRRYKTQAGEQKEEVTYVDCNAFGRTGEVVSQYTQKGDPLFVEGRLRLEQWESEGQKRSKLSVTVESVQLLKRRGDGDSQEQPEASRPLGQRPPRKPVSNPIGDEQHFNDADIPF